ncbi:MAG: Do family serine endopeptidase [Thiohalorhabdus sp.]
MYSQRPIAGLWKAAILGLGVVTTACAGSDDERKEQSGTTAVEEASGSSAAALPAFSDIVQDNREAVVNISTTRKMDGPGQEIPERFRGTPFEDFFQRFFEGPGGGREREVQSLGSGFVVSSDGHIVTNAHVVQEASEIVVQFADRRQRKAEVLGKDMATDLAVLKVDADDLPTVRWSDGEAPQVGEWVLAMGSPFGFEHSVTSGIISAKGRSIPGQAGSYVPFLQTDVAINPGSSGGPLFNLDGEVVGVNAQIFSKSGGYMGLSFAIPSDMARDVVAEIKEDGEVSHGYLGVGIQELDRDLARSMGLEKPRGGLVADVKPDSPADEAGLQSGDIILEVDGESIDRSGDIPPLIGRLDPGTEVTLTLLREEERIEKTATLGSLQEARSEAQGGESATEPTSVVGMRLVPVPDRLREQQSLPESGGALIEAMEEGPAQEAGFRTGDVILKIGDASIAGPGEVEEILDRVESGARVPVLVQRGEGMQYLPLRVP